MSLKGILHLENELLILGNFNIKSDIINTPETQTPLTDINSTTLTKVTQGDFISDHSFVDCELAIQETAEKPNGDIVETSKR